MYPTCDTLARSVLPAQQEPGSAFRMESCSGLPEDRFFRGGVPHFGTAFVRSINVTVSGPRRGGRVAAPPPAEGRSGATAVRTIFPGSRTPSCTGCLNRDSDGRETPLRCPHGRPLRPFLRALRRSYGRRCGHPERGARPASPYSCSSLRRRRAPAVTEIVSGRMCDFCFPLAMAWTTSRRTPSRLRLEIRPGAGHGQNVHCQHYGGPSTSSRVPDSR